LCAQCCEECNGDGTLVKGKGKRATAELRDKVKQVEKLIETVEDLDELERLEAALKKRTLASLDEVLSAARKAEAEKQEAEAWALKEAEELKAKQEANRKKEEEAAKQEAERVKRMQEMEAEGKKVSGGLHKFDASEVDVHGGKATADDFMDAFGF
jgi:colicin import membrane protein